MLLVEEGQPNFLEQNIANVLRQADLQTGCTARTCCRWPASTRCRRCCEGLRAFLERYGALVPSGPPPQVIRARHRRRRPADRHPSLPQPLAEVVHGAPAGLCTGCPERPIFSAMKLVERELGAHHVSADIGCHLFSILPPFHIGNTTMGYGLGTAGASAFTPRTRREARDQRSWATAASGTTA